MVLIIGGAWQGKLAFARELAGEKKTAYEPCRAAECKKTSYGSFKVAEGSTDSFEAALDCQIIHGFHEYVRRLLKEKEKRGSIYRGNEGQNPEVIITSNELGCGIVPMDRNDREWREASGRASVRLARNSVRVYRLVCGIASRIK